MSPVSSLIPVVVPRVQSGGLRRKGGRDLFANQPIGQRVPYSERLLVNAYGAERNWLTRVLIGVSMLVAAMACLSHLSLPLAIVSFGMSVVLMMAAVMLRKYTELFILTPSHQRCYLHRQWAQLYQFDPGEGRQVLHPRAPAVDIWSRLVHDGPLVFPSEQDVQALKWAVSELRGVVPVVRLGFESPFAHCPLHIVGDAPDALYEAVVELYRPEQVRVRYVDTQVPYVIWPSCRLPTDDRRGDEGERVILVGAGRSQFANLYANTPITLTGDEFIELCLPRAAKRGRWRRRRK